MTKKIFFLLILFFAMGCVSATMMIMKAPVPADIHLMPPDPSLPDVAKALSGEWSGQWDTVTSLNLWDCKLYVEKVGKENVQIVISWGKKMHDHGSCHCYPGMRRINNVGLTYSADEANIQFSRPGLPEGTSGMNAGKAYESQGRHTYRFTLKKNNPATMDGRLNAGGHTFKTIMTHVGNNDESTNAVAPHLRQEVLILQASTPRLREASLVP